MTQPDSEDFSFQNLTPDTLINALESVQIYPVSGLLALNSYENRVYQFAADDGRRYVAKFYRPGRWSTEQILEEHRFTLELVDDEVPVVAPLALAGETLHHYQGYRFCVFPSVGGRAFEPTDLDSLERLGRQIGRLHRVAQAAPFTQRPSLNYQDYVADAIPMLEQASLLPDANREAFFAIMYPLAERLQRISLAEYDIQRLHGDCHIGNVLEYEQQLTFVDLDDCRSGPAVQDLWMMLNGDRQEQTLQMDALLCGYEDFCQFDKKQLSLVEPLRGFRIIQYMAWLAKRWEDPAFKRAFPWFAENRYWEQQILVMKEQLAALEEPPIALGW
ncbi:serine/threonine protein kinase [Idiomarina tyrosinivorans]|uniref:Stress response kinase A n=1 Tax=Idiomarina tyrosinivorans TaxID=1445662 RepID=A0A432ZSQ3_9GAMM|nr:serine/threonine protein kinase [Idiomarina tyrosinivorans]RUO80919.1 serine/threonine protein kinase [Idiomarina tyrosinivorans]